MSAIPWFKDWFKSPFYHKLYFERDDKEAAAFISKLIDHLKCSRDSYILDIACGRGHYSRLMFEKGFKVTGIDISSDNIAFAKKYENENLEFYQHDMRLPFRVNYFDHAFNFFTGFGYFRTRRENDDCIRTIANGLKPNGTFVIDYLNVHYVEDHIIPNEEKSINGTNYEIHCWHDENHFYKKIIVRDPQLLHAVDYTEEISKFSFGDFNDMLSYHGLQVQEVFGDYKLGNYDIKSKPRLIIVATKSTRK